jgi:thiamine phosphate synthase YjbQ (UPF0047 family)
MVYSLQIFTRHTEYILIIIYKQRQNVKEDLMKKLNKVDLYGLYM